MLGTADADEIGAMDAPMVQDDVADRAPAVGAGLCHFPKAPPWALGRKFVRNTSFFAHRRQNGAQHFPAALKVSPNGLSQTIVGKLDILLHGTIRKKEGKKAILDVHQRVLAETNVGDLHVVRRGGHVGELLAREQIDANQIDLGMAVFAGPTGCHVHDLARTSFDDDVSVLAKSGALGGVRGGST